MGSPFAPGDVCPECTATHFGAVCVTLHADEIPEPGAWCSTCLLPSGYTVRPVARCCHGWPLGAVRVTPLLFCPDCEQQSPAE